MAIIAKDDDWYEEQSILHASQSIDGTRVDIKYLEWVVDRCKEIVDEYESDIESGSLFAHDFYDDLSKDEKSWVNGQLNVKRLNKATGKQHAYWATFKLMLQAAADE